MSVAARPEGEGTRRWKDRDGRLHRAKGPAYEGANGTRGWYEHGQCIRVGFGDGRGDWDKRRDAPNWKKP